MTLDEMRRLDATKTYKELEDARNEIQILLNTISELKEVNEYLRQKNDKLEYGRTSK